MRVLVACEFSGIVRDAFTARGHDAVSCDLLPSERPGNHYQGDVRDMLWQAWDLMVAFPPCTYLCRSGAWRHSGSPGQAAALDFVRLLMECGGPQRWAIENPVGAISSHIRKPDQIIQPWQFGHAETKATCLWLSGVPRLTPTKIMLPPYATRVSNAGNVPDRWKRRSRTLPGIAAAMAEQWGAPCG